MKAIEARLFPVLLYVVEDLIPAGRPLQWIRQRTDQSFGWPNPTFVCFKPQRNSGIRGVPEDVFGSVAQADLQYMIVGSLVYWFGKALLCFLMGNNLDCADPLIAGRNVWHGGCFPSSAAVQGFSCSSAHC